MSTITEKFKENIVEGRYTVLFFSVLVVVMRFFLFTVYGVPEASFPDTGFLWTFIAPLFAHPWVSIFFSTFFVFLIAILMSMLNRRFLLIRTRTNLLFIVPIFLFSLHPIFLAMSPAYIAIVFILMALFPLIGSYQQIDSQLFSFRSSILIGFASLFQIFVLLMLPIWWWWGEVSMRGLQPKAFFTFILGIVLLYMSVFSLYFWFDDVSGFIQPFLIFSSIKPIDIYHFLLIERIFIGVFFLLFLLYIILCLTLLARSRILTFSSNKFFVIVGVLALVFQTLYWYDTSFFLWLCLALKGYLIAYYHSLAESGGQVYLAFLVIIVYVVFFGVNFTGG